ncbi:polysaccharide deacetylase family protein [Terriglobus roseus]|uniref:Peptidoglycan/xylan/chitin deacetylase, PgdA/CDA1 family n=1 Tax=Terriglobus roseus TaxID=392734 RepID=A0A1H4Q212_9BACT|nr:polysaccharide deacetylase family protein [Terriglobus roseus]SEC13462.1 Peptidoglycan/xylan/chitin deacetylase, PgdA/CDA1 family [Terriglobus roseus]
MNALLDVGAGAAALGLLAGGYAYAANWPTSQIFGRTLIAGRDGADGLHRVALTYDDGPSPRNTPALLDLLADHHVHATFFLIGEHVRKHPDLARRVVAGGHVIGNHTAMHPNLRKKYDARVRGELATCQKTIEDTLGITPVLFRPPYGARRPGVLRIAQSLGLTPVMWNVTAHDWDPIGSDAILARIDKGMRANGKRGVASNILLHDASHLDGIEPASRVDTITVTRTLLRRKGLHFVTPLDWLEDFRKH